MIGVGLVSAHGLSLALDSLESLLTVRLRDQARAVRGNVAWRGGTSPSALLERRKGRMR